MLGRLLGHSGAWASYQDAVPSHPFSPLQLQLTVHAEFLPVVLPAAGLGGVCVCDLRLCEGESPSHASRTASSQWLRPLLTPEQAQLETRLFLLAALLTLVNLCNKIAIAVSVSEGTGGPLARA